MNARWVVIVPVAVLGFEHVGLPLRDLVAVLVLLNKSFRAKAVPAIPTRAIVLPVHVLAFFITARRNEARVGRAVVARISVVDRVAIVEPGASPRRQRSV